MTIDAQHMFVSRGITTGTSYENRPQDIFSKLGRNIAQGVGGQQLAVFNRATNTHVATNVTQEKLDKLKLVDDFTGPRDKDIRRSERLLGGMGIDMTGMGNEMRIRMARIGVENEGLVNAISTVHGLGQAGQVDPSIGLKLARMVEKHGAASVQDILPLVQQVVNGTLNGQVLLDILSVGDHSPVLAGKLAGMAQDTINGVPNARPMQTVEWVCNQAVTDEVMQDLRGPNFLNPGGLPTQVDLGFTPALHIRLPQNVYDQMKLQFQAQGDRFRFDDGTRTVHSAYGYQRLAELCPELKQAAQDAASLELPGSPLQNWGIVEKAFGNPQWVENRQDQRLQLLSNCHEHWHNFNYGVCDGAVQPGVLQPGLNGLDRNGGISYLLGGPPGMNYPGFSISESHNTPEGKQYLIGAMGELRAQGVSTLYIEHIMQDMQPALDEYLNSNPLDPMPQGLRSFLESSDRSQGISGHYPNNLLGLVEECKRNDMRVVGLDNNVLSRRVPGQDMKIRDMTVNHLGMETINNDGGRGIPGKYVILAGAAHNNSHEGLNVGIPGFSQIFSIPAVTTNGNTLAPDPDDNTRRVA